MDAEGNVSAALDALDQQKARTMENLTKSHPLTIKLPSRTKPPQIQEIEERLLESIEILKERRRIIGPLPTLDDLIEPPEEKEAKNSQYKFEGGDQEIVAEVKHQLAVARGEIIKVDEDSDDEDN